MRPASVMLAGRILPAMVTILYFNHSGPLKNQPQITSEMFYARTSLAALALLLLFTYAADAWPRQDGGQGVAELVAQLRKTEVGYEKWTPSTEGFSILRGGIHDGEVTPAGLHQRVPPAG